MENLCCLWQQNMIRDRHHLCNKLKLKAKNFAIFPGKEKNRTITITITIKYMNHKAIKQDKLHMNNNRNQPPIVNLVPAMEETMNRKRKRKLLIKLKRKRIEGERGMFLFRRRRVISCLHSSSSVAGKLHKPERQRRMKENTRIF